MMLSVRAIPAFEDNYIWLVQSPVNHKALIIDPGDAQPVLHELKHHQLTLAAVLVTHNHHDHIGGIDQLLSEYPAAIYGPTAGVILNSINVVGDNAVIKVVDFPDIIVLQVAGHTSDHIAFLIEDSLFCGDTLFGAGCGRLLGGTAPQLFQSLQLLAQLPPSTKVYCTHEYTHANLQFALEVEPSNLLLQQRVTETQALRKAKQPSLPSTIALELATNPFLRCEQAEIIRSVEKHSNQSLNSPIETFTALRKWKDQY